MDYGNTQNEVPRGTRINHILAQNPPGVPMTSNWLASRRVSPQLLQGYKSSGWLSPLGRGALDTGRHGTYFTGVNLRFAATRVGNRLPRGMHGVGVSGALALSATWNKPGSAAWRRG